MNPKFDFNDKRHPLYNTWWNMMARCYIQIAPGFESYGARNIKVDEDWHDFKKFAKDVGEIKPSGMSLDRIDNDIGYSRKNCKWSSRSDQMLNRRQFKNNKSGSTGVVKIGDRYEARFHYESVRYRIGRFDTPNEAKRARDKFAIEFNSDKVLAVSKLEVPTVWCTSETKIRGVSRHKDGGYVVRVTKGGVRKYVGYFKTLNEAEDARREFNKE